jgi:hypothetical protein
MGPILLAAAETWDVFTFSVSVIKQRIIKDLPLAAKPDQPRRSESASMRRPEGVGPCHSEPASAGEVEPGCGRPSPQAKSRP